MSAGMGDASAGGGGSCGLQARLTHYGEERKERTCHALPGCQPPLRASLLTSGRGEGAGRREWIMRPARLIKINSTFSLVFWACLMHTNLIHVFTLKFTNSVLFLTW